MAQRFLVALLLHPPDHSAAAHLRASARDAAPPSDIPPASPSPYGHGHGQGQGQGHGHGYAPPTPSTAYTQPPRAQPPYTQPPYTQPDRPAYTQPTPDGLHPAHTGRSVWPSSLRAPYPAAGFVTPHDARAAPGASGAVQASPTYPAAAAAAAVAAELSAAAAKAAAVAATPPAVAATPPRSAVSSRPSCVQFGSPGTPIAAARQMHFS